MVCSMSYFQRPGVASLRFPQDRDDAVTAALLDAKRVRGNVWDGVIDGELDDIGAVISGDRAERARSPCRSSENGRPCVQVGQRDRALVDSDQGAGVNDEHVMGAAPVGTRA